MELNKSSRHSKITGDFAEGLVLYWLSKYGYEAARVDHTGIDLIARSRDATEYIGISVKCRCRYEGTEGASINLPADGFDKARRACEWFGGCVPYYGIVVDGASAIRCFLLSVAHLEELVGTAGGMRYWQMSERRLRQYAADPQIRRFELSTVGCSWRDDLCTQ